MNRSDLDKLTYTAMLVEKLADMAATPDQKQKAVAVGDAMSAFEKSMKEQE